MIPVEVGQLRRDPDPRMGGRIVRVVEVGAPSAYHDDVGTAALVEVIGTGRRSRIRLDRLARWEVVTP